MKNHTQTVSKGRIVFFQNKRMLEDALEPEPAMVTRVHDNDTVDLTIFPSDASPYIRTSVTFFDGFDMKASVDVAWWWPPRV